MPFITEELWQRLAHGGGRESAHPISISLSRYPRIVATKPNPDAERSFALLQSVVTAARELRADSKLDPKTTYKASLHVHGATIPECDLPVIENLVRLTIDNGSGKPPVGGLVRSTPEFDLRIEAEVQSMNGAGTTESAARLEKEIARLKTVIENSKRQLADEAFLSKAPEKVVGILRAKLADYEIHLKKNKDLLGGLQ